MKHNKVLVIAAHMDDEVLGCGGTIAKHKDKGDKVWVIFIARRIYNHRFDADKNQIEKNHAARAKSILNYDKAVFLDLNDERLDASIQDVIIPVEKYIKSLKPEIVYVPFKKDNNQDHRAVFDAVRVAVRPLATPFMQALYMYEVISSTEQSPPLPENAFLPNYYVDIAKYIHKKIDAYRCYATEKRRYPHPRSERGLKILAQKRGMEIGFRYAEAFVCIRHKWE